MKDPVLGMERAAKRSQEDAPSEVEEKADAFSGATGRPRSNLKDPKKGLSARIGGPHSDCSFHSATRRRFSRTARVDTNRKCKSR